MSRAHCVIEVEEADDDDADGHLVGPGILDQAEEGIEDEGDEKDVQDIHES